MMDQFLNLRKTWNGIGRDEKHVRKLVYSKHAPVELHFHDKPRVRHIVFAAKVLLIQRFLNLVLRTVGDVPSRETHREWIDRVSHRRHHSRENFTHDQSQSDKSQKSCAAQVRKW
jgi:hypothetical protein